MVEEVTVETSAEKPAKRPRYPGMSPLQAGLYYGGAAASVAGPLGLLVGLGAGIVSKRMRDNWLDREARDAQNLSVEYGSLKDEITAEKEIADPDERRLLEHAQRIANDGWYRLQSGDDEGRAMIEQANETIRGIMNGDIQARKSEQAAQFNFQRGLVGSSANTYRDQFSTLQQQTEDINAQVQRVLDLTADPNFDPNKPFNKAVLADILTVGVNGLFKDSPTGFLNALAEGAPALGMLLGPAGKVATATGGLLGAVNTGLEDEKFKISREEYNRIALNMRKITQQYAQERGTTLMQQAGSLNQFARKVGAIPEDYDLTQYVTGGVKELKMRPEVAIVPPSTETTAPLTQRISDFWNSRMQQRPPNARTTSRLTTPDQSMPVEQEENTWQRPYTTREYQAMQDRVKQRRNRIVRPTN